MHKFLQDKIFTDQKIKVNKNDTEESLVIDVHQVILSYKSPVFLNIFLKKDWNQNKNEIPIQTDASLADFSTFIEIMYNDPEKYPQVNDQNCLPLLILANEYQVTGLLNFCKEKIYENHINESSVIELLTIYDNFGLDYEPLMNYLCGNFQTVFLSKTFKEDIVKIPEKVMEEFLKREDIGSLESNVLITLDFWMKATESKRKDFYKYIQVDQIDEKTLVKDLMNMNIKDHVKIQRMSRFFLRLDFTKDEYLITPHKLKMTSSVKRKDNYAIFSKIQNIQFEDSDAFDLLSKEMTIVLWIKPYKTQNNRLLCKAKAGTSNCFTFDIYPNNSLRFICHDYYQTEPWNIPNNVWSFVAVSYTPKSVTRYFNEKSKTEKQDSKIQKNSLPLRIGFDSDGTNNYEGEMSNIRIFEKSLSDVQIKNLYEIEKSNYLNVQK